MFNKDHIRLRWAADFRILNGADPAPMTYDFVAIDFETASSRYDSACSIGISAVKDGAICDRFYSLLSPGGVFDDANIAVHGITPEMVATAPSLRELWPQISHFFNGNTIIAHNADFDISVLKRSLRDLPIPDFWYINSISIAKNAVKGSRSLEACANAFGFCLDCHHNAQADADACAQVVLCTLQALGIDCLEQLYIKTGNFQIKFYSELQPPVELKKEHTPRNLPAYSKVNYKDIHPMAGAVQSEHLLNKQIVFTGTLRMDRAEAMQRAVNAGAIVKSGVSRKTDYLVVGIQDRTLVGDDGLSGKEEKAYALNAAGLANVRIINEDDFLALLK